jgi:hypothetical protein
VLRTQTWTGLRIFAAYEEIEMILKMIHRQIGFAGLACALSLGGSLSMQAQDNSSTTTKDQTTTTTTTTQSYDSADWKAPRGYDVAYPENGSPNMVARQGYAAGFSQGQADVGRGQNFKPTESGAYAHAKIPKGMDKDRFKLEFRESFVKGYSNGFKSE